MAEVIEVQFIRIEQQIRTEWRYHDRCTHSHQYCTDMKYLEVNGFPHVVLKRKVSEVPKGAFCEGCEMYFHGEPSRNISTNCSDRLTLSEEETEPDELR